MKYGIELKKPVTPSAMDEIPGKIAKDSSLTEYVDADISVDGLENPGREKTVHTILEKLPGVQSVIIANGKVTVRYDPLQITKNELIHAIQSSGFRMTDLKLGAASSVTDAFAQKPGPQTDETLPATPDRP